MFATFSGVIIIFSLAISSGCGSTIRGIGKDASRIGRGIKMIFVSGEAEERKKTRQEKPAFSDFFKVESEKRKTHR